MFHTELQDMVQLLTDQRPEQFPYERAIRLFQFQVWMLYPDQKFTALAGLTAATKVLDYIADKGFGEEQELKQRSTYSWRAPFINLSDRPAQTLDIVSSHRKIRGYEAVYDTFIADLGGLPALLNALPPSGLDKEIRNRIESCSVVSDLMHYRLRYALTMGPSGKASTHRHAKFFVWWPTRQMTGRRGVRIPEKAPSPKTMDKWWKEWERTAVFLFLNDRCDFKLFPAAADDELFVEKLLTAANDIDKLKRFFGAYAFVREAIFPGQVSQLQMTVPESIGRIPLQVEPFTPDELEIIAAYKENGFLLGNYQPGDDD